MPPTRITELAARVHGGEEGRRGRSSSSSSLLPRPADVLGGCRFLGTAPEELRLSDVGALLEEYRALASLAAELAGRVHGHGQRG